LKLAQHGTARAPDRSNILNIGGFSGAVFGVVSAFLSNDAGCFIADVGAIEL
jgi:60 kDa SS-A/Ro ribonucleoprotein